MTANRFPVELKDVRKTYRLGKSKHPTLKEFVVNLARGRKPSGCFEVLSGISFSVKESEVLGLIGENGSGKSTILRLIAGITAPSSGEIAVHGRVSSLLEIGTGFHPEMTGRENIFLSAALLGISQEEIARSFDDIVRFAELEQFIDTPVKHYSSGMYMRLGFSVATRVNPDILLIDEVLAVGDEIFQQRSKETILQMAAKGKTLIFVSHDLAAVHEICTRCILLESGQIAAEGRTHEIISEYQSRVFERKYGGGGRHRWYTRGGTMQAIIVSVRFYDEAHRQKLLFRSGEGMIVEVEYECEEELANAGFGISLSRDDYVVFGTTTYHCGIKVPPLKKGSGKFYLHLPALNLLPGVYFVTSVIYDNRVFETTQLRFVDKYVYDIYVRNHPFRIHADSPISNLDGTCLLEHSWEQQE